MSESNYMESSESMPLAVIAQEATSVNGFCVDSCHGTPRLSRLRSKTLAFSCYLQVLLT